MTDAIKKQIKKIMLYRNSSKKYIKKLKKAGVKIGENTYFFAPKNTIVDTQRPWLVEIGDYCKITQGVIILAHDYSRSVLRRVYGEVIGEARKTVIGDNVFIGVNSIVLMGTQIGSNTIVGAGSVCHGHYPDNVVIAGNPAKVICSLDQYYHKRKEAYVDEARQCAKDYYKHSGRKPSLADMGSFFPLYLPRTMNALSSVNTKMNGDNEKEIVDVVLNSEPLYDSFEAFLQDALRNPVG